MLTLVPGSLAPKADGKIQAEKWDLGLDWTMGQGGRWLSGCQRPQLRCTDKRVTWIPAEPCRCGIFRWAWTGRAQASHGISWSSYPKERWKEGHSGSLQSVTCWAREGNSIGGAAGSLQQEASLAEAPLMAGGKGRRKAPRWRLWGCKIVRLWVVGL